MRFPLVVAWQCSRRLLALGIAIHAAAVSGVFLSGLSGAAQVGCTALVALLGAQAWRRWQSGAGRLTLHSLAAGEYAPGAGPVSIPVVCTRQTLWSSLIVLELRSMDRAQCWRIAIADDALPRDEFRRLSVCLLAGALRPASAG